MSGGRITERVERSLGGQPTRSSGGPASGPAGSLPLSWGLGPSNEEKGDWGQCQGRGLPREWRRFKGQQSTWTSGGWHGLWLNSESPPESAYCSGLVWHLIRGWGTSNRGRGEGKVEDCLQEPREQGGSEGGWPTCSFDSVMSPFSNISTLCACCQLSIMVTKYLEQASFKEQSCFGSPVPGFYPPPPHPRQPASVFGA